MKTKIIMMTALLALLATGCGKDNGRYRLFAENMTAAGSDTKLLVNPSDLVTKWLEGEHINVNGTDAAIAKDGSNYVVDVTSEVDASTLWCIYPSNTNANGNVVTVANNNGSGGTITLSQLAVNFHSNNTHDMIFPMAAKATEDGDMEFKHLTAGFRFSLKSATPMNLYTFKVYVFGNGEVQSVNPGSMASYTVKWNTEGMVPSLPVGPVGEISSRDLKYGSEMVFNMKTEGEPGVTINSTPKQFCVPVNLCGMVKRITVVGFDNTGDQLFAKTINFGDGIAVTRNIMYPVRAIEL